MNFFQRVLLLKSDITLLDMIIFVTSKRSPKLDKKQLKDDKRKSRSTVNI